MACTSLQNNLIIIGVITFTVFNPVKGQIDGFLVQPNDTQVRAGENGSLSCVLNRAHGSDCFWNRNDQKVNTDGNNRYLYTGNRSDGDCSISILYSNVALDDGVWECGTKQTSDAIGLKSQPATYTVFILPNEPVIKVNGVPIKNGGYIAMDTASSQNEVVVECLSENGKPAANLTWIIATGQNIEGNYSVSDILTENKEQNATLLLTTPSDESWEGEKLTCIAQHLAYRIEELHLAYGIVASPIKTRSANLTSDYSVNPIHVVKNTNVNLTCNADGVPAPESQLKRRLSDADEWSLHTSSDAASTFTFTVPAFDAQFICVASNDNWESSVSSNIITIVTSDAQQTRTAVAMIFLVAVTIMGSHRVLMS